MSIEYKQKSLCNLQVLPLRISFYISILEVCSWQLRPTQQDWGWGQEPTGPYAVFPGPHRRLKERANNDLVPLHGWTVSQLCNHHSNSSGNINLGCKLNSSFSREKNSHLS